MLRAITSEMMYVLIAGVLAAAALVAFKSKLPTLFKGAAVLAAIGASAMMFAIDAKFWGVVVMGGAVIILFFLPWLDNSPVKSIRYRPDWHKYMYGIFVINFLILGYLGVKPVGVWGEVLGQDIAQRLSQLGTLFYFGFFLLMPWWSKIGEAKTVPSRVVFAPH
jgi:ubiquinol-cytochrome c reductase cytochrome b subunit